MSQQTANIEERVYDDATGAQGRQILAFCTVNGTRRSIAGALVRPGVAPVINIEAISLDSEAAAHEYARIFSAFAQWITVASQEGGPRPAQ